MARIDHLVLPVYDLEAAADLYARLGFTLAPRASHPWGTDNVCIQLADRTYIEHLAVVRPDDVPEPEGDAFSFGAYTRDFLARREGFSMLAIEGDGPEDDARRFEDLGLWLHSPSGMERDQRLPDGDTVRMAFRTQFATDEALGGEATVFGCYKAPADAFWNPAYQTHANGVTGVAAVLITEHEPGAADRLVRAADLADGQVVVEADASVPGPRLAGFILTATDTDALGGHVAAAGLTLAEDGDVSWLDSVRTFGVRVGFRIP